MCNIWQGDFPNVNTVDDGHTGTAPVSSFEPNGYGLYNVSGNVWEWCSDWFSRRHHVGGPRVDPKGPASGESKIAKGGSYLVPRVLLQPVPSGGENGIYAGQFRWAHGLPPGDGRGMMSESRERTTYVR